jgi:uncharacterized membrane protein YccC
MRIPPLTLNRLGATGSFRAYWHVDRPRLVHTLKSVLALVLAMWICMRLELATPRTAMVTVVIVMMNQQSGMVIAKGIYRGLGILAGSLMGVILMAFFAQQPVAFLVTLAAWIGLCVWGASYYRNYQSYVFLLAGYSTAVAAVPVWNNPYGIFDSVVYSISEVAIGIACASLVSALVFPQRTTSALLSLGLQHCTDFVAFIRKVGSQEMVDTTYPDTDQLKLLSQRPILESLRSAAVFEDPEWRLKDRLLIDMNQDFLDALAGFHALQTRFAQVMSEGGVEHQLMQDVLNELRSIIPLPPRDQTLKLEQVSRFNDDLESFLASFPTRLTAHNGNLAVTLSKENRQFFAFAATLYFSIIDLCAYLQRFVALRQPVDNAMIRLVPKYHAGRILNATNHVVAQTAGLRAALAVVVVGSLWIASGWTAGSSAVIAVAIVTALFASAPKPQLASRQMLSGCLAGSVAAFLFSFFVLPHLEGFTLLALCAALVVAVGSYINTMAPFATFGLGFNVYFCFVSNITNPSGFEPAALLDTGFAFLAGMAVAVGIFSLVAPYGGEFITESYIRQIRRLVAREACHAPLDQRLLLRFESNMRDFTLQLTDQTSRHAELQQRLLKSTSAAFDIGWSVIRIRLDCAEINLASCGEWDALQSRWLEAVSQLFEHPSPSVNDCAIGLTGQLRERIGLPSNFDDSTPTLIRFRLWGLLDATAVSLAKRAPTPEPAASVRRGWE